MLGGKKMKPESQLPLFQSWVNASSLHPFPQARGFPILTPTSQPLQGLRASQGQEPGSTYPHVLSTWPSVRHTAQKTLTSTAQENTMWEPPPASWVIVPTVYTDDWRPPLLPRMSAKTVGSEARRCGFKLLLLHLLVQSWVSHLTHLCLSVLICETGVRIGPIPSQSMVRISWVIFVQHRKQEWALCTLSKMASCDYYHDYYLRWKEVFLEWAFQSTLEGLASCNYISFNSSNELCSFKFLSLSPQRPGACLPGSY